MSETARGDDPKTIEQLVAQLERSFEMGCGPSSPTVRYLVRVGRRIDPPNGGACAEGMVRARFGPAADPRPVPGSWPRLLLLVIALLLLLIAAALGILAWLAWRAGPEIDRVVSSLSVPTKLEFVAFPSAVPVGTAIKTLPMVKVYDNLGLPVEGAEVEFTIRPVSAPPAGTTIFVKDAPALAYVVSSDVASSLQVKTDPKDGVLNNLLDFGIGFKMSEAGIDKVSIDEIGKTTLSLLTLADGQASLPYLLVGTKPGEFEIVAEVKNVVNPLRHSVKLKAVAGPTLLGFTPDPPAATVGTRVGTLKVAGTKLDRFDNPTDPLAKDAPVAVTVLDDKGNAVTDATIGADDASVTVAADNLTATAKANPSGEADFGAMKFVSAKKRDYTLKATQLDGAGAAVGRPATSKTFQVTGASP